MPIDWFTVCAQVVNFLILVYLLKRFLYKPILDAIDARESRIAAELADADAKKAEAKKDRDEFQQKNKVFDEQRAALFSKATDEADAERLHLLDEARKDAEAVRAKRKEALRTEQRSLSREISNWAQQQVLAITRKALSDLADTNLEERLGKVFVGRLRAMTGESKEQFAAALKASAQPAHLRSAFELPAAEKQTIESAVKETFGSEIQVEFETSPNLISGIELSANGLKVAWSISDYLTTLEKSAGDLLHDSTQLEAKPDLEQGHEKRAAAPKADN